MTRAPRPANSRESAGRAVNGLQDPAFRGCDRQLPGSPGHEKPHNWSIVNNSPDTVDLVLAVLSLRTSLACRSPCKEQGICRDRAATLRRRPSAARTPTRSALRLYANDNARRISCPGAKSPVSISHLLEFLIPVNGFLPTWIMPSRIESGSRQGGSKSGSTSTEAAARVSDRSITSGEKVVSSASARRR